jgi:hypothetical protein
MGADCLGTQYAATKAKGAIAENTRYDGPSVGTVKDEGGSVTPTGETNESGIYTSKNPNPGFSG